MLNKSYHEQTCSRTSAEGVRTLRDCTKTQYASFLRKRLYKNSIFRRSCERDCAKTQYFVVPAKETVQKLNISSFLRKRLYKNSIFRRSCERDCTKTQYFVVPAKETVQETQRSSFLTPLAPPSPPYQGGIEWKVPLIRGI